MTLDDNFTQRAHDFRMKAANAKQRGLFVGVFRVFKGGVSLSRVAACS